MTIDWNDVSAASSPNRRLSNWREALMELPFAPNPGSNADKAMIEFDRQARETGTPPNLVYTNIMGHLFLFSVSETSLLNYTMTDPPADVAGALGVCTAAKYLSKNPGRLKSKIPDFVPNGERLDDAIYALSVELFGAVRREYKNKGCMLGIVAVHYHIKDTEELDIDIIQRIHITKKYDLW